MRGRHTENYHSMYKRVSSKDFLNGYDREEQLGKPHSDVWREIGNPSWKRPLPHVLVATISSLLFGYHLGVVNDTLESISLDLGFSGNTLAEGLVVSMCLGGAFLGCLFSGSVADGLGRRKSFQLCALVMIAGPCMSARTNSLQGMLLGRFLVGTGMGLGPAVAALYVAEVSPDFVRGTYGSFTQIATCLGLLAALFIGVPARSVLGWWRVCFWVSAIPAALLALFMQFSVESPHWLFKKGRISETEMTFERLFGASHVKSALAELHKSEKGDETDAVKFSDLFRGRHYTVVYIGSVLYALQQLSGINAVFYFSSTVFKSAGMPSDIGNICVGLVNTSGSVVAMILVDKLGRKPLLVWSFMGMGVASLFQVVAASDSIPASGKMYISVGGMLLFVLAFSLGAGPVPGLLLSEIFPSRIRAKAMALCMGVHWAVNFFVGLLFLQLLELVGPKILYAIFGGFSLAGMAFVKKNVVETKGKSLQDIEMSLLSDEVID